MLLWFADALALLGALVAPAVVFITPLNVVDRNSAPTAWRCITVLCVTALTVYFIVMARGTIAGIRSHMVSLPAVMALVGSGLALGVAVLILVA